MWVQCTTEELAKLLLFNLDQKEISVNFLQIPHYNLVPTCEADTVLSQHPCYLPLVADDAKRQYTVGHNCNGK